VSRRPLDEVPAELEAQDEAAREADKAARKAIREQKKQQRKEDFQKRVDALKERAIVNTYLLVNGAPAARTPGQNRTAGRSIHRLGAECRWWTVHPLW
jgi:hypothetical protein